MNTVTTKTSDTMQKTLEQRASIYILIISLSLVPILYALKGEFSIPVQIAIVAALYWPGAILHQRARITDGANAGFKRLFSLGSSLFFTTMAVVITLLMAIAVDKPEYQTVTVARDIVLSVGAFFMVVSWGWAIISSCTNAFGYQKPRSSPVDLMTRAAMLTVFCALMLSNKAEEINSFLLSSPETAAASLLGLLIAALVTLFFGALYAYTDGYLGRPNYVNGGIGAYGMAKMKSPSSEAMHKNSQQ
jgi:hypothetical protein